ncbi:hypothetical protein HPB52_009366 [Rhipicephalus sanguineus]|uniref:CCHC-type domain-containing protein n=1 Tax=Rhipicephalus sanguineus TaxID=34632 RepID=A0A9D4SYC0_RHISA|nr:hypothetical protein HPB52_009366 [Rhipicephalus sanguineus]
MRTGTRYTKMDMRLENPLPNFARVGGHRATSEYRGVRRLCRRCNLEGHIKAQCDTSHCARYGVFGHRTDTCTNLCRRCGGTHASVDCTARKTYSMAAAMDVDEFPTLGKAPATGQTQRRSTTLRPPKRPKPSDAEDWPEPHETPEKTPAQATAITALEGQAGDRQADVQTPASMRRGEDDTASAVSWASVEDAVAGESDLGGGQGDGKEDRPEAGKGSQGERRLNLKGKTGPAASAAARGAWWNKKEDDDDAPHSCEVLQHVNDKYPGSLTEREKSEKAPGSEEAPKYSKTSNSSRQHPPPEPAPQYGGASQQRGREGAQHGFQHGEAGGRPN